MTNSEKKKKNNAGMPTFLILLMTIAATGFWYVAIYGDADFFMFDDRMTVYAGGTHFVNDAQTNASNIDLWVDADVADIILQNQADMGDDLIQIDWEYNCRARTDQPFTVDIDFYTENTTLQYIITIVQNDDDTFMAISDFDVEILISKDIIQLDIYLESEVGSADLDLINASIGDLYIKTTTGSIDAEIHNSMINGYTTIRTTTGSIYVNIVDSVVSEYTTLETTTGSIQTRFTDLEFTKSSHVKISATTGSIDLDWDQNVNLTHDVILDLDVTTGSIDFTISSPAVLTSYDVYLNADLGDMVFGGSIEEFDYLGDMHYQSIGFESSLADILTIDADTTLGSIDATIYVD